MPVGERSQLELMRTRARGKGEATDLGDGTRVSMWRVGERGPGSKDVCLHGSMHQSV